ncbi:septum site-determining protein Ssd [Actinocorallia longicatena]
MNALLLSRDPGLADDLFRLAAAASVELAVPSSAAQARALWTESPLVLLGADLPFASYPRRSGLVLVARAESVELYRHAMAAGAEHLAVLPEGEPWLIDRLAATTRPGPAGKVVTVTGARGGAGASVLAATLALVAAREGLRALLVDFDPLGGGIDLLFGLEAGPGPRWPELSGLRGRLPPDALTTLPAERGVSVLSHSHAAPVRIPAQVLDAVLLTARATHDLTIIDLPRGQVAGCDHSILLVPTDLRSVLTASTLASTLRSPLLVTRGPAPARLPPSAVAEATSLPLAAHYDFDRRTPAAAEQAGLPTKGALPSLCTALLPLLQ